MIPQTVASPVRGFADGTWSPYDMHGNLDSSMVVWYSGMALGAVAGFYLTASAPKNSGWSSASPSQRREAQSSILLGVTAMVGMGLLSRLL